MAPAATPPRMPRPTAGPQRRWALASLGAATSVAAIAAAAVSVVRVFIMEFWILIGAPGRAPNAVKGINHPRHGCQHRHVQFGRILKPHCEKMNKSADLAGGCHAGR